MLCNAMGGGRVSNFLDKALQRCTIHVISIMRGWVGVNFPEEKRYVTLE